MHDTIEICYQLGNPLEFRLRRIKGKEDFFIAEINGKQQERLTQQYSTMFKNF